MALRFGHRLSVDLDFFTTTDFDLRTLAAKFGVGPESITGQAHGTLQVLINNIKVEFLKHSYSKLAPDDCMQNLRMWSLADVAAMKLNAIINRGSKFFFYDIVALLDHFSLDAMIRYYKQKYSPASLLMAVRSPAWFEDANAEPDPVSLNGQTWPLIKDKIASAIRTLE